MTEQWEIDLYEKECKKIRPICGVKGECIIDVGSPFSVLNLFPKPDNVSSVYPEGVLINGMGQQFGVSLYVDQRFDADFDVKFIIPFRRQDSNGGNINMKLYVYAYKTDGSEYFNGWNVENGVVVYYPYSSYLEYYQWVYILHCENFEVGDLIGFVMEMNQNSRSVYIYSINVTYKKRRD